jgi:hypothetical protein
MRKSVKIALSFLLVLIETVCFTLVFGAVLNYNESGGVVDPNSNDSVFPKVQSVTKSNGFYNIHLAFVNVTYPERLDNILINPHSSETITGLIAYLNGTALDAGAPITCGLESGDSLEINLTFPCIEFASGSTITLCVLGDCFGCGTNVVLP